MSEQTTRTETVTLNQAKSLIKALAAHESLLLLSPPGIGKSDIVRQAANEAGLPVRSLLGTQIAPEDVSGIPRIVNERSVFCPPRILLPENPEPFCLFLDEFPAAAPDVQKALYALLLERRLGEHNLPKGTWVVAAGNRAEDRALVRQMSSALVNRTFILQVRSNVKEWLIWAQNSGIRSDIIAFITFMPDALMRAVPNSPVPFSTPRAWASLSSAMNLADKAGILKTSTLKALAFGRLSAADAVVFCTMLRHRVDGWKPLHTYIRDPRQLPSENSSLWFVLNRIRESIQHDTLVDAEGEKFPAEVLDSFLIQIPREHRFALLAGMVWKWGELGVNDAMFTSLQEVTGLVK